MAFHEPLLWGIGLQDPQAIQIVDVVTVGIYRVTVLAVGLAFALFGYKLFSKGLFEKAGDLKAAWGEKRLIIKQAAPGTFFALFGAIIVGISLFRSFEIQRGVAVPQDVASAMVKVIGNIGLTQNERVVISQWLNSSSVQSLITAENRNLDPPEELVQEQPKTGLRGS